MVATGRVPRLPWVDAHLKLLAEVSLAVERAETAAGDGAFTGAREALDEAARGFRSCASTGRRWGRRNARWWVGRPRRSSSASTPWPRAAAAERAEPGRARARSRAGAGPSRRVAGRRRRRSRRSPAVSTSLAPRRSQARRKSSAGLLALLAAAVRCSLTARGGMFCRALPCAGSTCHALFISVMAAALLLPSVALGAPRRRPLRRRPPSRATPSSGRR